MNTELNINDSVILKSFHGTTKKDDGTKDYENYWKLIGLKGEVIDIKTELNSFYPEKGFQVLVKFFEKISDYNLNCHNKIENSLWIFVTDLELIDKKS